MGRPESKTVEYFPFYVKDGDTLFLLESKFGCEGLGFFTAVLRFLSQTPDHHYCIEDPVKRMRFFAKAHVEEEKGMEMLDLMAVTGKINRVLWDGNRVIVSEDFLDSINEAYKKRKNEIITIEEILQHYGLMSPETPLTDTETELPQRKGDGNTQSKVKESKVKKKREEKQEKIPRFSKPTHTDFEKYCIEINYSGNYNRFYDYYEQKDWMIGRSRMKDWKAAVRTWKSRDQERNQSPPLRAPPQIPDPVCECGCREFARTLNDAKCRQCGSFYELQDKEWVLTESGKVIQFGRA